MSEKLNKINQYCSDHTTSQSNLLWDLERETYLKTLSPQMLAGEFQGQLLSMISKLMQPNNILEIGTFTGYSAICLASGLSEEGRITTIEINPELSHISKKYFEKSPYSNKIIHIIGDALEEIPKLETTFDLIFVDAAKLIYNQYYDLVLPKLRKGGIILADNVLWSGKVVHSLKDKDTNSLDQFNKRIHTDNRVENILLPIRDGINIIRKL